jgi:hypothetical protein
LHAQDLIEPKSYKEAANSTYKDYWFKSESNELKTLEDNNTWELVLKLEGVKIIYSCWAYKLKDKGEIYEFKSRFVAKGFEQKFGFNYIDTFASVIKQLAWRLLFALAIINSWLIYKIDMISAFTQGNIDYFIYITQPEGHINSKYPDYVLKLNKALYGLK